MLRHLLRLSLAQRTITIRVDYFVRVISLLLMIGILTSCVPEEDAAESTLDGNILRVGDVQILWGGDVTRNTNITFSAPFSEVPTVIGMQTLNLTVSGFTTNVDGNWQAIGKYK